MEKKTKKKNPLLRLSAFLVTVALVAGALSLVVFRDQLNMDALKRYISYRSLTRDSQGQAQSFPYDGGPNDSFANLDGSLLVAGDTGIRLYSPGGVLLSDESVSLSAPVVYANRRYAVVYDVGGLSLRLYNGNGLLLSLESEGKLLSATVNSSGWLAVTHQKSGHKGAVTIFNGEQKKRMQFNFSSRFVMDALVAEDNSSVAVVSMGQSGSGFASYLSYYALDPSLEVGTHPDSAPLAECNLGSSVALSLRADGDRFRVLGDNSLSLCSASGERLARYDYSDRYLKEFSLEGSSFTALLLGKHRAGSAADLVVLDGNGQAAHTLSLNEQVLSLSAAGRYIGVLTADRLDIYTQDLTLYSTLEGTSGARRLLMREDGSAMLIGDTAFLYLPT